IFTRMAPTQQDIQTLHGVVTAIAEGRKGPARGGILDGREAGLLRELLAEHGGGRVPGERGPVRGLSRLLRRNPTDEERALWEARTKDRRFASCGFKRQVPIGPHIVDIVSFPLRAAIDLVPGGESPEAGQARARKRAWLKARDYRVCEVAAGEVEADGAAALERIARAFGIGRAGEAGPQPRARSSVILWRAGKADMSCRSWLRSWWMASTSPGVTFSLAISLTAARTIRPSCNRMFSVRV